MRHTSLPCITVGAAIAGAGLIGLSPAASPAVGISVGLAAGGADIEAPDVAFVIGPTGIPTPSPAEVAASAGVYLPGFGGTAQALTTPATAAFPSATIAGAHDVIDGVQAQLAADVGHVSLFGYSQGAVVAGMAMQKLAAAGVGPSQVSAVLAGDTAAPNGGLLPMFSIGIPGFDTATPTGPYPTDIYTIEYDGWADWPRYSSNLLADMNAMAGMLFSHWAYWGLSPAQVAGAELTAQAGSTDYHLVPQESLPLLDLWRLAPPGNALADLVQPYLKVLVGLGYGNLDGNGWNDWDGATPVTAVWGQPDFNQDDIQAALGEAWQQGVDDFYADLTDPGYWTDFNPLVDVQWVEQLVNAAQVTMF